MIDNEHVFAKGSFEVGEIDYNWAMTNFMKVNHPVPLTVKMTTEGQIIIHFSRELLMPQSEFLLDLVQSMIDLDYITLTMQETETSPAISVLGTFDASAF